MTDEERAIADRLLELQNAGQLRSPALIRLAQRIALRGDPDAPASYSRVHHRHSRS